MTGRDARIEAQTLSGMKIDKNTALIWMKDAIRDIVARYPGSAGIPVSEEFFADKTEPYFFKMILAQIRRVILLGTDERIRYALNPDTDFRIENNNSIIVKNKGRYIAEYYAVPDFKGSFNESTEIPLPVMFQGALRYKLAAEIRGRAIGVSDRETLIYEQQYNDAVLRAQVFATRQNKRRMPPRKY
jgi:hypothetical protein